MQPLNEKYKNRAMGIVCCWKRSLIRYEIQIKIFLANSISSGRKLFLGCIPVSAYREKRPVWSETRAPAAAVGILRRFRYSRRLQGKFRF
ncbi:MAG TPA: hypothetical protein DDW50_08365 [Firmicutes bacterium]|nr:hypothetical protein [Bacillota bacterium]